MINVDVLIVGGGPAGSSLAYQLGREGFKVLLAEKRKFPREKVCGEFLNPRGTRLLKEMGLYSKLHCFKPEAVTGQILHSYNETVMKGHYGGVDGFALKRPILDKILLDAAGETNGVLIWENARVDAIETNTLNERLVTITIGTERKITVKPKLLVGADGVKSIVKKKLFTNCSKNFQTKYALASRFKNVPHQNCGEMYLSQYGYIGLAPLGKNVVGLSMVFGKEESLKINGNREKFFYEVLKSVPELWKRVQSARQICPVEATGWVSHYSRRVTNRNALLLGDAACFIDPFTGEGMSLALLASRLLAKILTKNRVKKNFIRKSLKEYELAFHAYFLPTSIRCLLLQSLLYRRQIVDRFLGKVAGKKRVADRLIQIFGGVQPQYKLLSVPFWVTAFK